MKIPRCPACNIIVPIIDGVVETHSDFRALFTGAREVKCIGSGVDVNQIKDEDTANTQRGTSCLN